jgi:hypothetical protein
VENGDTHVDFVQFDDLDKERKIRFDLNAVSEYEDFARRSIIDVVFVAPSLTLGDVRALLWAGLKWEEPRLTRERVGLLMEDYLISGGTLGDLAAAIRLAVNRSRLFIALATGTNPNSQGEASKASPNSETGLSAS